MERHIFLTLSFIIFSLKMNINDVEGLPPLNQTSLNDSLVSSNEVLFISVNATEEDVIEMSSRLRYLPIKFLLNIARRMSKNK